MLTTLTCTFFGCIFIDRNLSYPERCPSPTRGCLVFIHADVLGQGWWVAQELKHSSVRGRCYQ